MKKTATKSAAAKSSVPAKKPAAKSAPAKSVKAPKAPKAPKAAKPSVAPSVKATKPVASSPKAKAKPAAVTTTIVAAVDVGFGNHLTLRGAGPGLSWEAGLPLECTADDRWSITLPETAQPIVCKFLINDSTWCLGEDYTVLPGSSVVLSPNF